MSGQMLEVAEQLCHRGHDAVAVQDPGQVHLRGIDDCVLLSCAHDERRAVVTDNVADFFRYHQRRIEAGDSHHGLLLFTNETFSGHGHDLFVSQAIAALERALTPSPDDDGTGWIRWLTSGSG
ncbi:MAG: DUF5615 family PIN-like protein [Euzebyales bacterium]|nr:DUF5615 family PIN-like protein [Euzebyales bacterium]